MPSHYIRLFRLFRDKIAIGRERDMGRLALAWAVIWWICTVSMVALIGIVVAHSGVRLYERNANGVIVIGPLFFAIMGGSLFVTMIGVLQVPLMSGTEHSPSEFRSLRLFTCALAQAVTSGDSELAPLASQGENNDTPVPDDRGMPSNETFEHVALPNRFQGPIAVVYLTSALALLLLIGLVVVGVVFLSLPNQWQEAGGAAPSAADPLGVWLRTYQYVLFPEIIGVAFIVIACGGMAWAFLAWRYARMERGGCRVRANTVGLSVRFQRCAHSTTTILWKDVQGFARLRYRDEHLHDHTVYWLISPLQDFLWDAPAISKYVAQSIIDEENNLRANGLRLAETVEQRIEQPLRDVSWPVHAASPDSASVFGEPFWYVGRGAVGVVQEAGDPAHALELWRIVQPGNRGPGKGVAWTGRSILQRLSREQRNDFTRMTRVMLPYYAEAAPLMAPKPRLLSFYRAFGLVVASLNLAVMIAVFVGLYVGRR